VEIRGERRLSLAHGEIDAVRLKIRQAFACQDLHFDIGMLAGKPGVRLR
jgi:hypothetical protein